MKNRLLLVVALALVALAGCSTGSNAVDQSAGSSNGYVQVGKHAKVYDTGQRKTAPPVTADLIGGGTFNLQAQRGHVVVMNLWGSWCPDCRVEARDLQSAYAAHKDSGVVFVGLDIRDDPDGAQAYQRNFGVTYPSINDPSGRVALAFRDVPPSAIPSTLVIDAHGRVAALNLGVITADELNALIAAAK
jgi:peroxiredoxin